MSERDYKFKFQHMFSGRKPDMHEAGPPHEAARQVRDTILNAIDYGAIGSETAIPAQSDKKATKLPVLLHYSRTVMDHYKTLRGILSAPREFQIVDRPGTPWDSDTADGDAIYRTEGKNHVYYLASHLTSPYINSWMAAANNLEGNTPFLSVAIFKNNENKNGIWEATYGFSDHIDMSSDGNISMSNLYPERDMILQFWFSKTKLPAKYIFDKLPCAPVVKQHLSLVGERTDNGFRQIVIHFEGKKFADLEEKQRVWGDDLPDRYAAFLRKRGDFDYSIVEIGTTNLSGVKHYIYTGSETARVEVKSEVRAPSASTVLAHSTITG